MHQIHDLRNLDEPVRQALVSNQIDKMLENQICTICKKNFVDRHEKDNATVSGKDPLTFAHDYCWKSTQQLAK